ncbi:MULTISPECIES: cytochrome C [Amniculibacterium]|jgi:hypothetical protein|uniref:cytochrome C n=1 Tax=Amniculibacterium TaxID=2715289 RepID=UPI000F591E9C|nr:MULTISPECIES: cytochrome C [Amniculibacterium]
MNTPKTTVLIYIDDEPNPIANLDPPIVFQLDTTKLTDGDHQLKIISKFENKEGIKIIPFTVQNGPVIHVDGLSNNDTINGTVPLMLNAYDTGKNQNFIIKGSENPRTIPVWVWVLILSILAWGAFYSITSAINSPN